MQRPVYFCDIYKATLENPLPGQPKSLREHLLDLFKMDLVLADSENNLYSLDPTRQRNLETNPDSEFELCSDRMLRKFPGYSLAEDT